MSALTAGFDFVAQITAGTMLNVLQSRWASLGIKQITTLTPPFSMESLDPNVPAHVNVSAVTLQVQNGGAVALRMSMADSELPGTKGITNIKGGTLTVNLMLALRDAKTENGTPGKQLVVDMTQATVSILPDPGLTALFITAQLNKLGSIPVAAAIAVVPGQGNLAAMQFSSMELHTRADMNAAFLCASAGTTPGANFTTLAGSLLAGGEGVGLAISAAAFQSQLLCPALAVKFGVPVSGMPTVCGSGTPSIKGFQVKSIGFKFGNGVLDIHGSAERSTSTYDATGSINGHLTLQPSGSTVQPHLDWDEPDTSVSPRGWLLLGSILFPMSLFTTGIFALMIDALGGIVGQILLNKATGHMSPLDLGSLLNVGTLAVTRSAISPGGITVAGTLSLKPGQAQKQGFRLASKSDVTNILPGTPIPMVAYIPSAFHYTNTLYQCNTVATCSIDTSGIPFPLSNVHWSFAFGSSGFMPLESGTKTFEVTTLNHTSTGEVMPVNTSVTVSAQASDFGVILKNTPTDGNYMCTIRVDAMDAAGQAHSAQSLVEITGSFLDVSQAYTDALNKWKKQINDKFKTIPPPPSPGGDPGVFERYIESIVSNPSPEAGLLLRGMTQAFPAASQQVLYVGASALRVNTRLPGVGIGNSVFDGKSIVDSVGAATAGH